MKIRKLAMVLAVTAVMMATLAPAALGSPSEEGFKTNDAWLCEDDGFVENHCLGVNSNGNTLTIKVFDDRGPQESASADPRADGRPCPHDGGGSGPFGTDPTAGDGTWWDFLYGSPAGPLYVCHHSGQQQFLP
jgi:hypothetical protein